MLVPRLYLRLYLLLGQALVACIVARFAKLFNYMKWVYLSMLKTAQTSGRFYVTISCS